MKEQGQKVGQEEASFSRRHPDWTSPAPQGAPEGSALLARYRASSAETLVAECNLGGEGLAEGGGGRVKEVRRKGKEGGVRRGQRTQCTEA